MRRRIGLGLAGLLALAGAALAGELPSLRDEGLSGVRVDVQPLIAQGAGLQAEALQSDLKAALTRNFADRLGGRGPVLVVRLKGLTLNPYAGGDGGRGRFGGGGQSDYLDGEALLVTRSGRVTMRHPQLSALPASSGGAWYDPDSERRRLTVLAEHYAGWLRRAFPAE